MKAFIVAFMLGACVMAQAQSTNSVPLWPDGVPGALGKSPNDVPTLTVYLPDATKASGAAMVICPGGGYGHLANHEGEHYARWLNELGITGYVLKYRLGTHGYQHPAMMQDATRALRLIRFRAAEWKVDPKRVGIMGSSAGGHLASTLLTHFDSGKGDAVDPVELQGSRPDLVVLCYPVVTLTDPFTHKGSRQNLLGTNPPAALVQELSAELRVTSNSPPCFIWHTFEDKAVPVENSLQLAAALRRVKVPVDLHIYERGGHGIGLGSPAFDVAKRHLWVRDCEFWLRQHGFAN